MEEKKGEKAGLKEGRRGQARGKGTKTKETRGGTSMPAATVAPPSPFLSAPLAWRRWVFTGKEELLGQPGGEGIDDFGARHHSTPIPPLSDRRLALPDKDIEVGHGRVFSR